MALPLAGSRAGPRWGGAVFFLVCTCLFWPVPAPPTYECFTVRWNYGRNESYLSPITTTCRGGALTDPGSYLQSCPEGHDYDKSTNTGMRVSRLLS